MVIVHRLKWIGLLFGILGSIVACAPSGTRPATPAVGAAAPDFALPLLDGGTVRLAEQKGRVVIVNFWASWCTPCVDETPRLVAWQEHHRAAGLQVLGVNTLFQDDRPTVEAFVKDYRVSYPVPLDEEGTISQQWRAQQLPRSYVIDRQGIVRFVRIGELSERDLETQVLPLLR